MESEKESGVSDIVFRLRQAWPGNAKLHDEAADEIESLRQRVAELEVVIKDFAEIERGMEEELAALKAGQGEPVAYLVYNPKASEQWLAFDSDLGDKDGNQITPLYTSAPTIPERWVMVPVEPTDAMRIAGNVRAAMWQGKDAGKAVWYDMLAAAPKPEDK